MYSEETVTGIKNMYISTKAEAQKWLGSGVGSGGDGFGRVIGIRMTKLKDF